MHDDSTPRLKVCAKCGATLPPPRATGRPRRYCSDACRQAANPARCAAYRAAHVEEIRIREAAYGAAHREERRAYGVAYRAAHVEEKLAYDVAHREENRARCAAYHAAHVEEGRAYRAAHYAAHVEETRVRNAAHYAAHVEERRARCAAWRVAHIEEDRARSRTRRSRKRGAEGTHTAADVRAQLKRQRGRCFYCKDKVGKAYHADHVTPLVKNGHNGPENLVITCPRCNLSKGAKHPMDFAGMLF